MVSETRRTAIRRFYRMARMVVDKTQIEVETLARLSAGQFWKIENGLAFPSDEKDEGKSSERQRIAKVLKVNEADIPTEQPVAKAS